jgi:hypothetical protein
VVDTKNYMHLLVRHVHPLHQGADQLPLPVPIRLLKSCMDLRSEVLQTPNDQPEVRVEGGLIDQALVLRFQVRDPLPEAGDARFEFLFLDEPLGITVNQPGKALPEFPQLGFDGGVLLPFRTGGRV